MTKTETVIDFLNKHYSYVKKNQYVLQEAVLKHTGVLVNTQTCKKAQQEFRKKRKENKVETSFNKPFKRLFFDIETSPNIGFFWQCGYKVNIGHHNIIRERAIICVSYKWENESKVHHLHWNQGNDKQLLIDFIKILNQSSEAIAHNGDNFDVAWLRGRALYHQIPFPSHLKTLDTYLKTKNLFRLNSHKLDYLAKFLKVGGKIEDGGFQNWVDVVLYNSSEALQTMLTYCDNDVVILEDVYHKIKNYIKPNIHKGVAEGKPKWSCPLTGSKNVSLFKNEITASGNLQRLMTCHDNDYVYKISNSDYLNFLLTTNDTK
jgi:uncharacterized protein YprB with RNaseH-like and TPR domain